MPILVNCLQGRKALPERKWKLPTAIGWFADIVRERFSLIFDVNADFKQVSLSYIILTTVLFVFPPSSTVTGSNMSELTLPIPYWIFR